VNRRYHPVTPVPQLGRWTQAVRDAIARGAHHQHYLLGLDNLALVPAQTSDEVHHEVRVRDGRVQHCTCWAWRSRHVCRHAATVGLWLWRQELVARGSPIDPDTLDQEGARAVALTLCTRYIHGGDEPSPRTAYSYPGKGGHHDQPDPTNHTSPR